MCKPAREMRLQHNFTKYLGQSTHFLLFSIVAVTINCCTISDTFASKVAAIQDSTADNSVGNVTGSNAVNVFLGLGIAWSMASFYHSMHGRPFTIDAGKYVVF